MSPQGKHTNMVRLQRVLADAGVAARRTCEALIEEGRVSVNGQVVQKLPAFVDPDTDRISVDGRPITRHARLVYVMLHKPADTLVTMEPQSEEGRRTVLHLVDHPSAPRLFPVGRLDFETTGLLLLTNDGELANRLTHPRFEVPKTYHVSVRGGVEDDALLAIAKKLGSDADDPRGDRRRALPGRQTGLAALRRGGDTPHAPAKPARGSPAQIRIFKREPGKTILEVTLRDAQNRRLRDVLKYLGMPVKKLSRVAVGPLRLSGLGLGQWRELTRDEIRLLKSATRPKTNRGTRAPGPPIHKGAGGRPARPSE
jgi:23S rRNA pseudouridine2605 synthase